MSTHKLLEFFKNGKNGEKVFKSGISKKVISENIENKLLAIKTDFMNLFNDVMDLLLSRIADAFDITESRRFKDRGLKFLDKQYMIYRTEVLISEIIFTEDKEEMIKRLSQVGFLFFDLDGLKPINEFSSQLAGDNILILMSCVMSFGEQSALDLPESKNLKSKANQYCQKNNLETVSTYFSEGDEFVVLIKRTDNKDLSLEDVEELGRLFQEDMGQIDTRCIIDLQSKKTIQKCKKRGMEDLRIKLLEKYPDYRFPFTASFGASTLFLASLVFSEAVGQEEMEEMNHNKFLGRLMRIFYQIAEDSCKERKEKYKANLKEQGIRGEFLSNLFIRSDAGRQLAFQNDLLFKILESRLENKKIVLNQFEIKSLKEAIKERKKDFSIFDIYLD